MIKSADVRQELARAKVVLESDGVSIEEKLKAIGKLLEVEIKISLGTRLNVVKVMEKLEIEKVKPQVNDEKPNRTD